tara:strand:+ start:599 stop:787 length:189 start_codon:yes stop_codon:yes gene_type:complete
MRDETQDLVYECIATHNEEVLIELIKNLKKQYTELAKLSTFGEYKEEEWTHEDVLNYVTYHT